MSSHKYSMTISRLIVDKLGVKLYDRVSAVIAELVSNSYDADATEVMIKAPMGKYLASKKGGDITDLGLEVHVVDDGIGMTPDELNKLYLVVGAERRESEGHGRGDLSPKYRRKVMGRKGVGKLAPFGICEIIEVITAGGNEIERTRNDGSREKGYLTSHIILEKTEMIKDTDRVYNPDPGEFDDTLSPHAGTTVILKRFAYRQVPAHEVFEKQLSQRFGINTRDWAIKTHDTVTNQERRLQSLSIPIMDNSKIEFKGPDGPNLPTKDQSSYSTIGQDGEPFEKLEPGFSHEDDFYPITGWVAYAREPHKDEIMAGIRIYCRGKIAAQTPIFNLGAGFSGEHSIRSYLVGELYADWLDEEEDLIQTDRRDILWSHEIGQKFENWGQSVVKRIGELARGPMRKTMQKKFFEAGNVRNRINNSFPNPDQEKIRGTALRLAEMFGRSIRPGEVEDEDVIESMVGLTLTIAPHITLDETLREAADSANTSAEMISTVLKTARLAELSSFGRIAEDRLGVIEKLTNLLDANGATTEMQLQKLIEYAPWLINPQWAPITSNESFTTFKERFKIFYEKNTGKSLNVDDFSEPNRRPDFIFSNQDNGLQLIEIKRPGHVLLNEEMSRITNYKQQLEAFLDSSGNEEFRRKFHPFFITLVCDDINLSGDSLESYTGQVNAKILSHIKWDVFLAGTRQMHQDFLKEAEKQKLYLNKE